MFFFILQDQKHQNQAAAAGVPAARRSNRPNTASSTWKSQFINYKFLNLYVLYYFLYVIYVSYFYLKNKIIK